VLDAGGLLRPRKQGDKHSHWRTMWPSMFLEGLMGLQPDRDIWQTDWTKGYRGVRTVCYNHRRRYGNATFDSLMAHLGYGGKTRDLDRRHARKIPCCDRLSIDLDALQSKSNAPLSWNV
jgi:hypothetical protein